MIDPKLMCRQHLLGEHNEIHKHRHNFVKGHSIKGRVDPKVLVVPYAMQSRHDQLVEEMLRRGYKHMSPYELPDLTPYESYKDLVADIGYNIHDLCERCEECNKIIEGA
jgi:hypothetical protein